MPLDFSAILYGPIYAVLRVACTLAPDGGDAVDVYAIDKTAGIALGQSGTGGQAVDVQTVRPAAIMRAVDLDAAGISTADLVDATLVMNGTTWRVVSFLERPSPNGAADGEVYLILQDATS